MVENPVNIIANCYHIRIDVTIDGSGQQMFVYARFEINAGFMVGQTLRSCYRYNVVMFDGNFISGIVRYYQYFKRRKMFEIPQ